MKIAVLGTGMVGQAIATRLLDLGHEVKMGSRTDNHPKATEWVAKFPQNASQGTFADAARFAEILFNCTSGGASLIALEAAGEENMQGKILIDLANPLDFSQGMPPQLSVCNTDSLGEQIQRAFPQTLVVKTLNTMNCNIMVNPGLVGEGEHHVFLSGNDPEAKQKVRELLLSFGWKDAFILDLGDITTARGTEAWLPLWLRIWGATGSGQFNLRLVK
ncbi:NADP oxidoreductase [bacterium (Candidatus Blackallbacteria) CG17_big_fil_post_rev_8_21_14_2_50_48_46]|uniref:NADP oxidoreductase n=1 Tax=bacterium (Candidatus Blackallbacteria) CG17_big_fil_post_rev_8_21_14_2_50_48_46 TaxID=2014261 RepID=A0A2M7G9X1_9BACT|nr:MAG: NADP oxidoreductase [bacterium (Candidatus Blackallbacteria) CG18_big_fil_WC_8_21_14_2_50_49_26]PIW18664.1 MAG: NADP oxidoreductase [bacterium (Candidatus Blackallbacteria) CG17_big_fil_post_rev_8_21_14_2_50_48_46]PIW46350.1 MAG: NADP oxidoreductase [bacterium (Candidatus Blackallbacteria) CG13_big_fil_rev_8_21_14_2_50_49_14]